MPLSREMSDDEGIEVLFNAESEQFSLANVATRFITSDVNRAISHSGPEVYLSEIKPVFLESQCIPVDPTLWRVREADAFFAARRDISSLSRSMNLCEKGFRTGSCSRTYRSSSGPRNFRECGTIVGTRRTCALPRWLRGRALGIDSGSAGGGG